MKNEVTVGTLKLLMHLLENKNPNISHDMLYSHFTDSADFLINGNYLEKGADLQHYRPPCYEDDVAVYYREELNAFAYITATGFEIVPDNALKTYDIKIDPVINLLRKKLDILQSSANPRNKYLDGLLYYLGDCYIHKSKVSVFFARKLVDKEAISNLESFFSKPPTSLCNLILASSHSSPIDSLQSGAKIISVVELLEYSRKKEILNKTYIHNVLLDGSQSEYKPYARCTEDGGVLLIGEKKWQINGDKQRQVIKIMCEEYRVSPNTKIRWSTIMEKVDTNSRVFNLFKKNPVNTVIGYGEGFVWFIEE